MSDVAGGADEGRPVTVTLKIGVKETSAAMAASSWDDANAAAGEMMKNWLVVVTGLDNKIEAIVESGVLAEEKEHDEVSLDITAGEKYFYSFANIPREDVLGTAGVGSVVDFTAKTCSVNGNTTVLPETGIPMSNRQKVNVTGYNDIELYVVRMWAKIRLELTNETTAAIRINSVTLSEITENASLNGNAPNLKLLPAPLDGADGAACRPSLAAGAARADLTIGIPEADQTVGAAGAADGGHTKAVTFYVNESDIPAANAHGLFTLTLEVVKADGTPDHLRYGLITETDDVRYDDAGYGEWNYIARNDCRVIPVTLQEYRLDIVPYDWPPIGVLPASVRDEAGLFTVTFHAAGHFHLKPVLTRYGSNASLDYGESGVAGTWCVAKDNSGNVTGWSNEGTIPTDFYAADDNSTTDACENGGMPRWDAANHFVYGYLKDTGVLSSGTAAPRVFHALTVRVNAGGGSPAVRELTYRLCVVKDLAY